MSIRCVCRNGHVLKVKDSLAGAVVICPACKTHVSVPKPQAEQVSEDVILHILGEHAPPSHPETTEKFDWFSDTTPSGVHRPAAPKKCCERCNQEVPVGTHICPHCRTYIAGISDF